MFNCLINNNICFNELFYKLKCNQHNFFFILSNLSYFNFMGELSLYALGNYVLPPDNINTKLTTMTIAHFTRMHNGPKSGTSFEERTEDSRLFSYLC